MQKIHIFLTAHNPLQRAETTLRVLKEYEDIPVDITVEIFIDYEHRYDLDAFSLLVGAENFPFQISFTVAPIDYHGYALCWAHKDRFKQVVREKAADAYMYSENDMLFGANQFLYWLDTKDKLRRVGLEPGFCRFERWLDKKIPFDNYRKWNLIGPTPDCWGRIPHNGEFLVDFKDPYRLGYVSLGNPYAGLMILDQQDAEKYIVSESCDVSRSYALTGKRNWPIADRSSMGLAFEGLKPGQEHRRVVPVERCFDDLIVPHYALVEHLDQKYAPALVDKGAIIDTNSMLTY